MTVEQTLSISAPYVLPVLTACSNSPERARPGLTKSYRFDPDRETWSKTASAPNVARFDVSALRVASLDELGDALIKLDASPSSCVVRDTLRDESTTRFVNRRSAARHEDGAWLLCDRAWCCLDIDGWPAPVGWDWDDESVWGELFGAALVARLPMFAGVGLIIQWSSSARIKDDNQLHAHVWFLTSAPVCSAAWKMWAKQQNGGHDHASQLDASLYDAVHIHYTAAPRLTGACDPINSRVFTVKGAELDVEEVELLCGADEFSERTQHNTTHARPGDTAAPVFLNADSPASLLRIQNALRSLPAPDSNEAWIKICCAVHHGTGGSEAGWALLCAWSARDSNYCAQMERANRVRWDSLSTTGKALITVGSLYHAARACGWTDEHAAERRPVAPTEAYDACAAPITLTGAQARLSEVVRDAFDWTGTHVIAISPGAGKTYTTIGELVTRLEDDEEMTAIWATPTLATVEEAVSRIRDEANAHGNLVSGSELDRLLRVVPGRGPKTCRRWDLVESVIHAHPLASLEVCGSCPYFHENAAPGQTCDYWRARLGASSRFQVMTHTRALMLASTGSLSADVIVWDESPLDLVRVEIEADAGMVLSACARLGWNDSARLALADMVGSPEPFIGGEVQARLDRIGVSLPVLSGDQLGELLEPVAKSLRGCRDEYDMALFAGEQPDWRVYRALNRAARVGFAGVRIESGRLFVPDVVKPDGKAETTLVLDATMTRSVAEALWDVDQYIALRVEWSDQARVIHLPEEYSARDVRGGTHQRVRKALSWRAWHGLGVDAHTLHVTHKGYRAAGATKTTCERLEETAPLIHFRGAEGVGWDGGGHCTRAVMDTWHVPRAAVHALAATLAEMIGLDPSDPLSIDATYPDALHHMRARTIVQTMHRVRPLRASEERPVALYLAMKESPELYGAPVSAVTSTSKLLWEAFGVLEGRNMDAAAAAIGAAVAHTHGAWCPKDSPLSCGEVWTRPAASVSLEDGEHFQRDFLEQARGRDVWAQIRRQDTAALATRAGLSVAQAHNGGRGRPALVFHSFATLGELASSGLLPQWCVEVGEAGSFARVPVGDHFDRNEALTQLLAELDMRDATGAWLGRVDVCEEIASVQIAPWATIPGAQRLLSEVGGLNALRELWTDSRPRVTQIKPTLASRVRLPVFSRLAAPLGRACMSIKVDGTKITVAFPPLIYPDLAQMPAAQHDEMITAFLAMLGADAADEARLRPVLEAECLRTLALLSSHQARFTRSRKSSLAQENT